MSSIHGERLILTPDQNKTLLRVTGIKAKSYSGAHTTAHCPFHKDKQPSLSVDFRKGVYFCFSCKRHGTLPQLVYEITGKGARSFVGAPDAGQPFDFQADNPGALLAMAQYYMEEEQSPEEVLADYDHLPKPEIRGQLIPWRKSIDVKKWVEKRLIPHQTADDWGFMYGVNVDVASPIIPEDPEEERSRFSSRRRLIVPLKGPSGNWISVESRSILDYDKLKTLYIKPTDFIFNYPNLNTSKPLYMCEGLVDAARLYPYAPNTTYLFGSHLSNVKKHLLKQFPFIVVAPDNDKPGYELVKRFVEAGIKTFIMPVPPRFEDLGDANMTNYQLQRWFEETEIQEMNSNKIRVILDRWEREQVQHDEYLEHIAYR